MTREEVEYRLEIALKCIGCEWHCYDNNNVVTCEYYEDKCRLDLREAIQTAISNGLSQEPCDDTVSIRKDVLKCRVGKLVVYNVEWLKKHWQMEMDIVCGVKPCDDAISREDRLIDLANAIESDESGYWTNKRISSALRNISSVTQKSGKSGKWILGINWKCNNCGFVDSGAHGFNYCPNCGCHMVEPQESEVRNEQKMG